MLLDEVSFSLETTLENLVLVLNEYTLDVSPVSEITYQKDLDEWYQLELEIETHNAGQEVIVKLTGKLLQGPLVILNRYDTQCYLHLRLTQPNVVKITLHEVDLDYGVRQYVERLLFTLATEYYPDSELVDLIAKIFPPSEVPAICRKRLLSINASRDETRILLARFAEHFVHLLYDLRDLRFYHEQRDFRTKMTEPLTPTEPLGLHLLFQFAPYKPSPEFIRGKPFYIYPLGIGRSEVYLVDTHSKQLACSEYAEDDYRLCEKKFFAQFAEYLEQNHLLNWHSGSLISEHQELQTGIPRDKDEGTNPSQTANTLPKGKPGRPRDPHYDEAFRLIKEEEYSIPQAYSWYLEVSEETETEGSQRKFRAAMQYRQKKGRKM
jgi:hypothetical protein